MRRASVDYDPAGAVRGRESWEAADEHRVVEAREALVEGMPLLRRAGQPADPQMERSNRWLLGVGHVCLLDGTLGPRGETLPDQRGQTKVMAAGGRSASQRWRSDRGAALSMAERSCRAWS